MHHKTQSTNIRAKLMSTRMIHNAMYNSTTKVKAWVLGAKVQKCFVCESNTGPSDLQSDALTTELTKRVTDRLKVKFMIVLFAMSLPFLDSTVPRCANRLMKVEMLWH